MKTTTNQQQNGIFTCCSDKGKNILFYILFSITVISIFLLWALIILDGYYDLFFTFFFVNITSSILTRLVKQTPSEQIDQVKSNNLFLILYIIYFINAITIVLLILYNSFIFAIIFTIIHTVCTGFYLFPVLPTITTTVSEDGEKILVSNQI